MYNKKKFLDYAEKRIFSSNRLLEYTILENILLNPEFLCIYGLDTTSLYAPESHIFNISITMPWCIGDGKLKNVTWNSSADKNISHTYKLIPEHLFDIYIEEKTNILDNNNRELIRHYPSENNEDETIIYGQYYFVKCPDIITDSIHKYIKSSGNFVLFDLKKIQKQDDVFSSFFIGEKNTLKDKGIYISRNNRITPDILKNIITKTYNEAISKML